MQLHGGLDWGGDLARPKKKGKCGAVTGGGEFLLAGE